MKRLNYNIGDIVGDNDITYLYEIQPRGNQNTRWAIFSCSCGKLFEARLSTVKRNSTKDCGCGINTSRQKHNLSGSKSYRCWKRIKNKCYNEDSDKYKDYGGRGIKLHEPWLNNPKAFCEYVESLPNYKYSMTLDRKDNDGNYEPGNLRWVNRLIQNKNRRNNKK